MMSAPARDLRLTSEIHFDAARRAERDSRRQFVSTLLAKRRANRVIAAVAFGSAFIGAFAASLLGG